jgi:hypothetical protein
MRMSEMPLPGTVPLRAPDSNGAAPDRIRLYPDAQPYSPPAAVHRPFRRNFMDRKDPFEASGHLIRSFTFSNSYDLEGTPPGDVAKEIQEKLQQQLADGNLAATRLEVVDFDDAKVHDETARRFYVTQTTTRRDTVVTVNTYFQAYGDHLYYSVRSYILPVLSIWKLFLAVAITFIVFQTASQFGLTMLKLILIAGLFFHLRKFIIDLAAGDSLSLALRKQYPGGLNGGTFDDDDATAFLKTNVSLTLSTIATILEKHGIETGLRTIVQRLEINNVSTNGGSIIGAAIGGIANRIAAEVRT